MVSEARPLPMTIDPDRDDRSAEQRVAALFHAHFDLVWRTVRRLGVPSATVDDAAQEVFVIAARKLAVIEPGKERAFLYGVAVRVAADARRAAGRHEVAADHALDVVVDALPDPSELLDRKRAREVLDDLIDRLPEDARDVFVLYELEGLTMAEIAVALELAAGTVASRLRRARELFGAAVARLEAARKGGRRG